MAAPAPVKSPPPKEVPLGGAPARELGNEKVPYDVLKFIPQESAEHYKIAPLAVADGVLEIGMVDAEDLGAYDALNFIAKSTGMPFKVFSIGQADFDKVLEMYKGLGGEVDRAVTDLQTEQKDDKPSTPQLDQEATFLDLDDPSIGRAPHAEDNRPIQEDAPTIKITSTILRFAIDGRASDIHIEPQATGVRVRYRVDGELHTSVILPLSTHRALAARIKVLASIRLDERRKPQDGRFSASIDGRGIDFRVSTFPSYYGEKIVIRILDRKQGFIALDQIGLTERNLSIMRRAIQAPHGLILVSGPTGSGKSTTLYSLLSEIDRESKNVLSLEDPIEYFIDGVTQSQMRPEIGYTFANGLRTTLRQDPDIIMVGEIRDAETASLAIQAALTGHLVLSTIHTNDSVGVVTRLVDMGVEPYLIPPVLIASIAQRLARTFSEGAEKESELTASEKLRIENDLKTLPEKFHFPLQTKVWEPQKTPTSPTGLRGRMAVFEIMEMTATIEKIILEHPVESKLWAAARAQGMLTMREDAIMKAFDKKIPFSEVNNLSTVLLEDEDVPEKGGSDGQRADDRGGKYMTDQKGKVILLDDDKFLADMYSMKFTQSGYEVTACLSAADAIAAIQKGFDPDAVLFDLVMPGTDGFAFLESLTSGKLAERAVKIALTNQSDDSEREKAMQLGVDRYIVKASMIPSEVVSAVGEEIAKKKGK